MSNTPINTTGNTTGNTTIGTEDATTVAGPSVTSASLCQAIHSLDTRQLQLTSRAIERAGRVSQQRFAAALLLMASALVITRLDRAQVSVRAVEQKRTDGEATLRGFAPSAVSQALKRYVPTLQAVAGALHTQAEAALQATSMDKASYGMFVLPGILADLAVNFGHTQRSSRSQSQKVDSAVMIVASLASVGMDLCDFIMDKPGSFGELARQPRAQLLSQVARSGMTDLSQDEVAHAGMFVIEAVIEPLKQIQKETSTATQILLRHLY